MQIDTTYIDFPDVALDPPRHVGGRILGGVRIETSACFAGRIVALEAPEALASLVVQRFRVGKYDLIDEPRTLRELVGDETVLAADFAADTPIVIELASPETKVEVSGLRLRIEAAA